MTSSPPGNFAARLAAAARRRPEQPALLWEGGSLSWRELEARAGGVARRLARDGVRPGDVVALLLPNAWGFVAALWGGLALGATVAPLNPLLAGDERERILGHLAPSAVIDAMPVEETGDIASSPDGAPPPSSSIRRAAPASPRARCSPTPRSRRPTNPGPAP